MGHYIEQAAHNVLLAVQNVPVWKPDQALLNQLHKNPSITALQWWPRKIILRKKGRNYKFHF